MCQALEVSRAGYAASFERAQRTARIAENPGHIHDCHATLLHLFGLDHLRLSHRHLGRDFRLTDVGGKVIHDWLA